MKFFINRDYEKKSQEKKTSKNVCTCVCVRVKYSLMYFGLKTKSYSNLKTVNFLLNFYIYIHYLLQLTLRYKSRVPM